MVECPKGRKIILTKPWQNRRFNKQDCFRVLHVPFGLLIQEKIFPLVINMPAGINLHCDCIL